MAGSTARGPYRLEMEEEEKLHGSSFDLGLGGFANSVISLPTNAIRGGGSAIGGIAFAGGNIIQDGADTVGLGGVTESIGQGTSAVVHGVGDVGETGLSATEDAAQLAGDTADAITSGGFKLFEGLTGILAGAGIGLVVLIIIIIVIVVAVSKSGKNEAAPPPPPPSRNSAGEAMNKLRGGDIRGAGENASAAIETAKSALLGALANAQNKGKGK